MSYPLGLVFITTSDPYLRLLRFITSCTFDIVGFYLTSNISGITETHLFLYHLLTRTYPIWATPPCNLDKIRKLPFIQRIVIRPFKGNDPNDFKMKFLSLKPKGNLDDHLNQILFYIVKKDADNHPFSYYFEFLESLGKDPWISYFTLPQNIFYNKINDNKWNLGDEYHKPFERLVGRWFNMFVSNIDFRSSFISLFRGTYHRYQSDYSSKKLAIRNATQFIEEILNSGTIPTERLLNCYQELRVLSDVDENKSKQSFTSYDLIQYPFNVRYNFFVRIPLDKREEKLKDGEIKEIKFIENNHTEDIRLFYNMMKDLQQDINLQRIPLININLLIRLCNQISQPLNFPKIDQLPPLSTHLIGFTTEYSEIKIKTKDGSDILLSTSNSDLDKLPLETVKEIGIILEGADFRFDNLRSKIADRIASENFSEI